MMHFFMIAISGNLYYYVTEIPLSRDNNSESFSLILFGNIVNIVCKIYCGVKLSGQVCFKIEIHKVVDIE